MTEGEFPESGSDFLLCETKVNFLLVIVEIYLMGIVQATQNIDMFEGDDPHHHYLVPTIEILFDKILVKISHDR